MSDQEPSDEKPKVKTAERRMPRVSTATGGLMPGVDPIKIFQSVQALEDIEYIEKLKRGFRD